MKTKTEKNKSILMGAGPLDREIKAGRNFIFAVKDEKAEVFGTPICHPTVDVAKRSFSMAVNNPQSLLSKFPSDFTLYLLAHYDERTAAFNLAQIPEPIINGSELVTQPKEV